MKKVYFIHPTYRTISPRSIRIKNITKEILKQQGDIDYRVLTLKFNLFGNKNIQRHEEVNRFNYLHILLRYLGIYKISKHFLSKAKYLEPYFLSNPIIRLDIVSRNIKKSLNDQEVAFVVVVSPFFNYLNVLWLRKQFPEARIIVDIGDPLHNNSAKVCKSNKTYDLEKRALLAADHIIVTNDATKKYFVNEYLINNISISVIPQGVDVELIEKSRLSIINKTINKGEITYAGLFYKRLREPDALFEYLCKQNHYYLNVYGSNKSLDLPNVSFLKKVPQEELFKAFHQSEWLVFIDNKYGIQTSGKIFELLAFNKPILFIRGDTKSETFLLAQKHQNVIFADNTYESIKMALEKHKNDNLAYNEINVKHSWAMRANCYLNVIKSNKPN